MLGIPYEKQLAEKQKNLKKLLEGIAVPEPVIGSKRTLNYRNKINAAFGLDKKNNVILGLYEEKSHNVIENKGCMIEDERAAGILATIKKLVTGFRLQVYSEHNGRGLLKHVQLRTSRSTGEIMVIFVCNDPVFPSKNNFVKALLKEHPEITTVIQNINPKDTTMVMGERNITLFGPGFIFDELCGNRYRISPGAFYQINTEQTKGLYEKALEFAELQPTDHVVDAYCGIGTIALTAARSAAKVTGVELNRTAVKDAVRNAKANGLLNTEFIAGDAGRFLTDAVSNGIKADVVFMDPPRSGSTPEFITACAKAAPSRIVYISCEPETLARDLKIFKKQGFAVKRVVGIDMFPQTEKLECVALLQR